MEPLMPVCTINNVQVQHQEVPTLCQMQQAGVQHAVPCSLNTIQLQPNLMPMNTLPDGVQQQHQQQQHQQQHHFPGVPGMSSQLIPGTHQLVPTNHHIMQMSNQMMAGPHQIVPETHSVVTHQVIPATQQIVTAHHEAVPLPHQAITSTCTSDPLVQTVPATCDISQVPIQQTVTFTIETSEPSEPKLSCLICSKTFEKRFQLNRHMKIHTDDKPHKCDFCNKGFFYASNLSQHRRSHTGEKPFSCGECGKKFAKLSGLKNHIYTHTGQADGGQSLPVRKQFTCEVCGRSFPQKYQMKRHLDMHNAGRSERSYKCRVCGDVAADYHAFIAHTNVHLVPPTSKPSKQDGKWCSICEKNITEGQVSDGKCESCGRKKITEVTWKTV